MIFWPIFIKNFIAIDSNGITLNLARSLFSKEGIKGDRSKVEETEKEPHAPKNARNIIRFLCFSNYVTQFIPYYSTLRYSHITPKRG